MKQKWRLALALAFTAGATYRYYVSEDITWAIILLLAAGFDLYMLNEANK